MSKLAALTCEQAIGPELAETCSAVGTHVTAGGRVLCDQHAGGYKRAATSKGSDGRPTTRLGLLLEEGGLDPLDWLARNIRPIHGAPRPKPRRRS